LVHTTTNIRKVALTESDRLRAFAESCLTAAKSMSLSKDAERLRTMAAEALEQAERLEMSFVSRAPQRSSQPVAQTTAAGSAAKKENNA
jgi:hypothetical protein